jgi:hypothetical protein
MREDDTFAWLLLLGSLGFVILLFLWEPFSKTYAKLSVKRRRRSKHRPGRSLG